MIPARLPATKKQTPPHLQGLSRRDAAWLTDRTKRLHRIIDRVEADRIALGRELLAVKEKLGHGRFGPWLAAEFELSWDTANDLMAVARTFKQLPAGTRIDVKALRVLARSSTPESVRREAVGLAEAGGRVTTATVRELLDVADRAARSARHRNAALAAELLEHVAAGAVRMPILSELLAQVPDAPSVEATGPADPSAPPPDLAAAAAEIHSLMNRVAESVRERGRHLVQMKPQLSGAQWEEWLEAEHEMTIAAADWFMAAAAEVAQ